MNFVALLLTLFVGLFILIGCVIGIKNKNNKKITDFSISIAFGVIIGLILLELIPHTFKALNNNLNTFRSISAIIILALIGIIVLKILDLFIPSHEHEAHHSHEHKNNNCHNKHLKHIGIVSAITIIIHNIIEGMSLYLVSSNSISSGLFMCIGIGLHNIPMGLVIATTLYNSNYSKKDSMLIH